MPAQYQLTVKQARRLIVDSVGLGKPWKFPKGKRGVAELVDRMSYVQVDTINVIERAHHHALWSRRPSYKPEQLVELQAKDRLVFECFPGVASYGPMKDYRFYLPRGGKHSENSWWRKWLGVHKDLVPKVLERVREEGPLSTSDFEITTGRAGAWWDWKPAKMALEYLFHTGELMIADRQNFQRIYDIPERVLPDWVDTTEPTDEELGRFAVRRILGLHGVFPVLKSRWWIAPKRVMVAAIDELVKEGEAVPVEIKGTEGPQAYALAETLERKVPSATKSVSILSPFDSLVIERDWLKRVFEFDYKIECYTPAQKRVYGYFCLPILSGADVVGRLDAKAERKEGVLAVKKIYLEKDIDEAVFIERVAKELKAFAKFNGCDSVRIDETSPIKLKETLQTAVGG